MTRCCPSCLPSVYLVLVAQLLWVLFLAVCVIYKISTNGVLQVVIHFTNWSWIFQLIFYASSLLFIFSLPFTHLVINVLFFPVVGLIWIVAVGVFVLLYTGPEFITDIFTTIPAGVVIIGNDLYHTYPIVAIFAYYIIQRKLIIAAEMRLYTAPTLQNHPSLQVVAAAYQVYGGPMFLVIVYLLIFDTNKIYQTEFNEFIAILIAFGALSVFSLVPFLFFFFYEGINDPQYAKRILDREDDFVLNTDYELELGARSAVEEAKKEMPSKPLLAAAKKSKVSFRYD